MRTYNSLLTMAPEVDEDGVLVGGQGQDIHTNHRLAQCSERGDVWKTHK